MFEKELVSVLMIFCLIYKGGGKVFELIVA